MKKCFVTVDGRVGRKGCARVAAAAIVLVGAAAALTGCANPDDLQPDRTAMLPPDQRVSDVPWNKPQGWENSSQLGALANDPRIGGSQQ
jgi:hypothetical protein